MQENDSHNISPISREGIERECRIRTLAKKLNGGVGVQEVRKRLDEVERQCRDLRPQVAAGDFPQASLDAVTELYEAWRLVYQQTVARAQSGRRGRHSDKDVVMALLETKRRTPLECET